VFVPVTTAKPKAQVHCRERGEGERRARSGNQGEVSEENGGRAIVVIEKLYLFTVEL
jgi:hypothetical protein